MPEAVCLTCGDCRHWRNQRGVRLADLRCKCGGQLRKFRGPCMKKVGDWSWCALETEHEGDCDVQTMKDMPGPTPKATETT